MCKQIFAIANFLLNMIYYMTASYYITASLLSNTTFFICLIFSNVKHPISFISWNNIKFDNVHFVSVPESSIRFLAL